MMPAAVPASVPLWKAETLFLYLTTVAVKIGVVLLLPALMCNNHDQNDTKFMALLRVCPGDCTSSPPLARHEGMKSLCSFCVLLLPYCSSVSGNESECLQRHIVLLF